MSLENLHKIYLSCWLCYEDSTRSLIQTQMEEKCLTPDSSPFWKMPKDADSRVETMTQEATKKIATKGYIMNYYKNLCKNDDQKTIKQ